VLSEPQWTLRGNQRLLTQSFNEYERQWITPSDFADTVDSQPSQDSQRMPDPNPKGGFAPNPNFFSVFGISPKLRQSLKPGRSAAHHPAKWRKMQQTIHAYHSSGLSGQFLINWSA
jgi:hypothetical protein